MFNRKAGGFQIYDDPTSSQPKDVISAQSHTLDLKLQIAMLQKLHKHTKIFGILVYKGEIKGIRFFDYSKRNFIDIAPWQINYFNVSGMRLSGVRKIELYKVDNEKHNQTLVVQYITQHEINNYYRPNRMTPNDLAKALSYIMDYIDDAQYETLMNEFRQ